MYRRLFIITLFLLTGCLYLWAQAPGQDATPPAQAQSGGPGLEALLQRYTAFPPQPGQEPPAQSRPRNLETLTVEEIVKKYAMPAPIPAETQAAGLAPAAERYCLQPAFTTRSFVIDPINNFFDETTIYFDNASQRQRVDITFNNPNETPLAIRIYLFPALDVSYRVTPLPDGSYACAQNSYNIPLSPLCFGPGSNATQAGSSRVGQTDLEHWRLETEFTFDEYALFKSGPYYTPVMIFSRAKISPTSLATFLMYYDYNGFNQTLPDPSVFDLPQACDGL